MDSNPTRAGANLACLPARQGRQVERAMAGQMSRVRRLIPCGGSKDIHPEVNMIKKLVQKKNLKGFCEVKETLAYWLSKTAEERVAAVERLRRQHHGSSARLQRTARIVKRSSS